MAQISADFSMLSASICEICVFADNICVDTYGWLLLLYSGEANLVIAYPPSPPAPLPLEEGGEVLKMALFPCRRERDCCKRRYSPLGEG